MKAETIESLDRYASEGIPTGGFLRAVLENNLSESFARADEENRADMFEICCYVYNEMPMLCHGSPGRVKDWIEMKKAKRMQGVST